MNQTPKPGTPFTQKEMMAFEARHYDNGFGEIGTSFDAPARPILTICGRFRDNELDECIQVIRESERRFNALPSLEARVKVLEEALGYLLDNVNDSSPAMYACISAARAALNPRPLAGKEE